MKKFAIRGYGELIKEVVIEKETPHFYTINGNRHSKQGSKYGLLFYDTHEEAKQALLDEGHERLELLRSKAKRQLEILDEINTLYKESN